METGLRILMLEDSEDDEQMVRRALGKESMVFKGLRVDTKDEFIDALESFNPDVILSDHSLPQFNSVQALKICQSKNIHVPFILVTGTVSEEFAVECLRNGADDYILKSNLSRLPIAIRYAIKHHDQEKKRIDNEIRLLDQNEELKKLNRELDLFVYSTSHNLRAPLRSVLGLVHLAKMDVQDGNNKENLNDYFDKMEESVDQLDETLKLIVEYSKSARLDDDIEEIDFHRFFRGLNTSLQVLDHYEEVQQIPLIITGPKLVCAKTRLSVVLLNLMTNAIRFYDRDKKDPFLKITVFQEEDHAKIVMEDNGVGIDETAKARVFEMFYRGNEHSMGSGLGLYIVKETLERMRGSITMESTKGKGTTFTVIIPSVQRKKVNLDLV